MGKRTKGTFGSGSLKGWVFDPFSIGVVLFVLFISLPIITGIGNTVTQQTIAQNPEMNQSQINTLNTFSTGWFDNSPDIMAVIIYFVLILSCFIAAGYEGANPAVTLLLGLIFIIVAELVSFGISDFAHAYISQANYLNIAPHYALTTYIMEYLPFFNGILTIAYIVFVIMRREGFSTFSGGGAGNVVST